MHVVLLFTTLYKVVLAFKPVGKTQVCNHSAFQMKAIEQFFHAAQRHIMLWKVALTFNSVRLSVNLIQWK